MMDAEQTPSILQAFASVFDSLDDPRFKRGIRHPFAGQIALVFLGLLAQIPYIAQIQRWADKHWDELKEPLGFDRPTPPVATTLCRNLAKLSLADFQAVVKPILLQILENSSAFVSVAVDGKAAKQAKDENGNTLFVLNLFVHDLKIALEQLNVRGEKTNEPHCLLTHLADLMADYPVLNTLCERSILGGGQTLYEASESWPELCLADQFSGVRVRANTFPWEEDV